MTIFNELKRRNVLRVAVAYLAVSWLLIQIVETIFPVFGLSEALIRLVIILAAIGFPLALIFSWLYELTPEGLKKEKDVDHSSSQARGTDKKLDRAIIIVLALSLGYFAFDKFVLDPARDVAMEESAAQRGRTEAIVDFYGDNSVAVLPFVNMSSDTEQEFFSDGISEELLNLLAKVPNLRVISRSSSFSFKGKDIDVPSIAKLLNVAHVLEGSVRKSGSKIRITAQLIEAGSDTHLWSETYDRELSDIFAVQDEISDAIVTSLKGTLGLDPADAPRESATSSIEAHEAFLRGRFLVTQRTQPTLEAAVAEFEKAVALDSGYALAHAELAIANLLLHNYRFLDRDEAVFRAAPHVVRALTLDPTLAQAHAAAGRLSFSQNRYNEEERSHYLRALEFNPSYSDVYNWLAPSYGNSYPPQYQKAFDAFEKAVQLDPLSQRALGNFIPVLIRMSRFAEADIELEKLAVIDPSMHAGMYGFRMGAAGEWSEWILGILNRRLLSTDGRLNRFLLANLLMSIGLVEDAQALFERPMPVWLLRAGKPEEALAIVEARLADDPASEDILENVYEYQAELGDYANAWPSWEDDWKEDPEGWSADDLAKLIAMRRSDSEDNDVSDLLAAMKEISRQLSEGGILFRGTIEYTSGLAALLEGDREKGIELIRQAVERGYYIFPKVAWLQSLYDDPDYASIIAIQEARQLRERGRFLGVVCVDNPYEAFWQPEEVSCEQFKAMKEYK